jgi:1-acyl-sn-glycerol-3-phosphate acyltransferase
VAQSAAYRSVIVSSQYALWLVGQLLRIRYSIRSYSTDDVFERDGQQCLILAPMHKSVLDPWLLMLSVNFRQFRSLIPVRILGTQDPRGALRSFMPLIRVLYWLGGVIKLPPEEQESRDLPEKLRGVLVALKHGDVVMIFPEGEIHRETEPPIGEFAPGVVYVHRRLDAPILPIAFWLSERSWWRRRCLVQLGHPVHIPKDLDQDAGASWLQKEVLALYRQLEKTANE